MPPTLAAARNTTCGRASANQPVDRGLIAQIDLAALDRQQFDVFLAEPAHQRAADHAAMPGNEDRLALQLKRECLPLATSRRAIARSPATISLTSCGEGRLGLPAELLARLAGVADQKIDFGRPEIDRIDANEGLAGLACRRRSRRRPCRAIRCVRPTSANASSTNSRTERVSPVASTKSSGSSACKILCMPST